MSEEVRRQAVRMLVASTGIDEGGAEGVVDALIGPHGPFAALVYTEQAVERVRALLDRQSARFAAGEGSPLTVAVVRRELDGPS